MMKAAIAPRKYVVAVVMGDEAHLNLAQWPRDLDVKPIPGDSRRAELVKRDAEAGKVDFIIVHAHHTPPVSKRILREQTQAPVIVYTHGCPTLAKNLHEVIGVPRPAITDAHAEPTPSDVKTRPNLEIIDGNQRLDAPSAPLTAPPRLVITEEKKMRAPSPPPPPKRPMWNADERAALLAAEEAARGDRSRLVDCFLDLAPESLRSSTELFKELERLKAERITQTHAYCLWPERWSHLCTVFEAVLRYEHMRNIVGNAVVYLKAVA